MQHYAESLEVHAYANAQSVINPGHEGRQPKAEADALAPRPGRWLEQYELSERVQEGSLILHVVDDSGLRAGHRSTGGSLEGAAMLDVHLGHAQSPWGKYMR